MVEANEVNSTFYALRLLSHGLDTSEIEVTEGEEYPASEFTREEQEQALEIIRSIEDSESLSLDQLPPDTIHFHVVALADRIEELANSDLANAGYTLQLPGAPLFQDDPLSAGAAAPVELVAQELEVLTRALAEINQLRRIIELHYVDGYRIEEIAEMMDLSRETIRTKLARARARLRQAFVQERLSHDPAHRT